MRSLGSTEVSVIGSNSGWFACPPVRGHAYTAENGARVALIGNVHWIDPMLQKMANDQGDTAALLYAFRNNGPELFSDIVGDFAVAILDPEANRLILGIDRMGARPMAFAQIDNGLVFGSTVDSVKNHPAISATVDPQAIFNYTYFHQIPSPYTIYDEIMKLQPGEYVLYADGNVRRGTYWAPNFDDTSTSSSMDLEIELREALSFGVQRSLSSYESTACFLSGGLDSSAVVGMAAEHLSAKPIAYTIGFEAAGYDEMYYARLAAKHFNVELREYYVTQQDIVDAMPRLAAEYDEPFGNSSAVPTLMCATRAKNDGINCMLAGDGGDELFGGNERYAKQSLFESYHRIPKSLRSTVLEPLTRLLPDLYPLSKLRSFVAQARIPMPGRLETYNLLNREPLEDIFEADFLGQVDTSLPLQLQSARYEAARSRSLVNKMIWLDWKFTLADNDLRKVTRSCEVAGVNVAYPMLDQALIDLSIRIPPDEKVKGQNLRRLYKKALQDFLPQEIIDKPKHGFGLPFGVWLASSKIIQDLLYPQIEALGDRGIFRPAFLSRLLAANRTEHAAFYGNQVYVLAMLELWLKAHSAEV